MGGEEGPGPLVPPKAPWRRRFAISNNAGLRRKKKAGGAYWGGTGGGGGEKRPAKGKKRKQFVHLGMSGRKVCIREGGGARG